MEVYIDDMLVKSAQAIDHVAHLKQCYEILNKYIMKLNPAKCTFGVTSGEFLGYLVTKCCIEANPKQISVIINLPSRKNTREVQCLTRQIAALNRFISRSTDKCLPFYQLLRGNKRFEWDKKCESAFKELKDYLSAPPVLAKPEQRETLYLYIAISCSAVSGVLVREDRGEQHPIFYLAYAVVISARKLRPYFQSHTVEVLTNQPLRTILHSPSQSGGLAKWAVELSEYDIEYKNCTCTKSQVLADFLVEPSPELKADTPPPEIWSLHVDGASSKMGSGVGIRLTSPTGEILEQSFRLAFSASNNNVEYEALIAGLHLAHGIGIKKIQAYCDSQLKTLINQALTSNLLPLAPATFLEAAHSVTDPNNVLAIALAVTRPTPTAANSTTPAMPVPAPDASSRDDWQIEIIAYIADGIMPKDKWEARRLRVKSAHYTMLDGSLFRLDANGALLICVNTKDVNDIMREVHEGAGGNHSGGRALALRIRRNGTLNPPQWTLLTNHGRRLYRIRKQMRKMSASCTLHPFPDRTPAHNVTTLSLYAMDDGYCRSTYTISPKEVPPNHGGLFHKVG
ncbi:PREDICTED: uncharacterized protein LOC104714901 [Camelina sativa]|uniref:Uncharacterized protein LOC104714901 n=1 Tax=Camelina sativa TaxID=90675 RepID=A0ABM0TSN9_CAMSA|nr:PREDICTED: uncharacterized protein LOC104714901 [Camelina sativa]